MQVRFIYFEKISFIALLLFFSLSQLFAFENVVQNIVPPDTTKGRFLLEEGIQLFKKQAFDDALVKYDSAIILLSEEKYGPSISLAEAWRQKATINYYQTKNDEAIRHLIKAQNIAKALGNAGRTGVINMTNDLGIFYFAKGMYREAASEFNDVLALRSDPANNQPPIRVAESYLNLGSTYGVQGKHSLALKYHQKALFIMIGIPEKDTAKIATAYHNISTDYYELKNYEKALEFAETALRDRVELFGDSHLDVSQSYNILGAIYNELKNYAKANEYYQKGLNIREKIYGDTHSSIAVIYANIGKNYFAMKNYNLAIKNYEKALEIQKRSQGDRHPDQAVPSCYMANLFVELNQFKKADEYLKLSLDMVSYSGVENIESVSSIPQLLQTLKSQCDYFWKKYNLTPSVETLKISLEKYEEAIAVFNHHLKSLSPTTRSNLAELSHPIYEGAILVNKLFFEKTGDEKYKKKAFELAERSKAILLYESIQEADALSFAGIPNALLEKEYKLRIDITFYDKKRQGKLSSGLLETDSKVLEITDKLFELNRQYDELKDRFEKDFPEYYRLKHDRSIRSVAEVQEVLRSDQSMLEYFVGDSSIFIFLVQKNNFDIKEIRKDFLLTEWVGQLQNGLFGYYGKSQDLRTDNLYKSTLKKYVTAASDLYEKLVSPIADMLTEEVILIPDGVLGYIPFEALLKIKPGRISDFDSYPFLLHDHHFSYCYSATLLREMSEKKHQQLTSKSLVAFAPFYEGNYVKLDKEFSAQLDTLASRADLSLFKDVATRQELQKLPNSGEEVFAASRLWNGDYFIDQDATLEKFIAVAGDYRIVHLSTHGTADSRVGDYSYLAFAEKIDDTENEYLYVRDLYNLQLNADLVVLSACETATGEFQKGEGIISLARAFAYAGAKSILTTLWVVDDTATMELTKTFHVELKKGLEKNKALSRAKRQHLEKSENSRKHPFFWSALIPVGDMSAMD